MSKVNFLYGKTNESLSTMYNEQDNCIIFGYDGSLRIKGHQGVDSFQKVIIPSSEAINNGTTALESINQVFGFNYTFDFINANWNEKSFDITDKIIGRQQQLKDCKILYLGSDNTGALYPQEGTRNNNGYSPARQTKLRIVDVYPGTNITLKTLNITGESVLNNSGNLKLISDINESNVHTITLNVINNTDTYINLQNANYTYYKEIRIYANDTIFPFRTELRNYANRGGIIYVDEYDKTDLYMALTDALADNDDYCVYDCTYFTGDIEFEDTIVLDKPCTILLGNATITTHGLNFFEIESNNVQIIGYGRQTDRTDTSANATTLVMENDSITNDSDKGYHIYSKGNKNLRFEYLTLKGIQTTLGRQCGNESYPIDGCGGIYIEKAKPITGGGGITCNNIIINQLLIDGTKAHGIYIDTAILSSITNTRLSHIAGHGIFLNNGTSVSVNNVYGASSQLAGFCTLGINYCTFNNCVSEYSGIGFLIRGSFNVSIFSPGTEETVCRGSNPWSNSQPISNKYGFNISTSEYDDNGDLVGTQIISDVNADIYNAFVGTPYIIVGGRGISLYTPYSIGIARGGDSPSFDRNKTALLRIIGNARQIFVNNIQGRYLNGANDANTPVYHDIKIESLDNNVPTGVELIYDVLNPLITHSYTSYITNNYTTYAPIYCADGADVLVRYGKSIYSDINTNNINTTNITVTNVNSNNLNTSSTNTNDITIGNVKLQSTISGVNGNNENTIFIDGKEINETHSETTTAQVIESGSILNATGLNSIDSAYIRTRDYITWNSNDVYEIIGNQSSYNGKLYLYETGEDTSFERTFVTYYDIASYTSSEINQKIHTEATTLYNTSTNNVIEFRFRFKTNDTSAITFNVTSSNSSSNIITHPKSIVIHENGDLYAKNIQDAIYALRDYEEQYLTIESLADNNNICIYNNDISNEGNTNDDIVISWSTDRYTWNDITPNGTDTLNIGGLTGTIITTINTGDKIYLKANNNLYYPNKFYITGNFKIYGNIMSLYSSDNFEKSNTISTANAFKGLFSDCLGLIDASKLKLNAKYLSPTATSCYESMFEGCSNMINAPSILPAISLSSACYKKMFKGCSSMTIAPRLEAIKCDINETYTEIFYDCSALSSITMLGYSFGSGDLTNWLSNISSTGTFIKNPLTDASLLDIPAGWTIKNYGQPLYTETHSYDNVVMWQLKALEDRIITLENQINT